MKSYFNKLKWTILQSYLFYGLYALTSSLFPLISQLLFDQYHRGLAFLGLIGLVFSLLIFTNLIMEYCNRVWEWKISKELALLLKADLFQRFIAQESQTFDRQKPIDYVSIITNHVEVVSEDYFSATIDLGKSLLKLLIFCISMTYVLNWQLTLVILGFSLVTSYLPNLTQKALSKLRKMDLAYQKSYNHKLLDLLSGYKYVSSQNVDIFKREHQVSLVERENYHFRFGRFRVLSDMIYSFGTNSMYLVVLMLAGYFLIKGQMTLGAASATLLYISSLIGAISDVISCVNVRHSSKEVVEEIKQELGKSVLEETPLLTKTVQELSLSSLSFRRGSLNLLAKNLKFKRGEMVAIIGHSGVGKSTFFNLLNGDLTAEEELISVDGVPLSSKMKQDYIFTLRQEEHLFEGDLMTNVTLFGKCPLKAEVKDLLTQIPVKMQKRLTSYPEIGELSGGEKQVISVLRALNMGFPILLMDEPFSQLDKETKNILSTFLRGIKDRIILEITHDTSPENLEHYSQVLIVEQGTVTKLLIRKL